MDIILAIAACLLVIVATQIRVELERIADALEKRGEGK